LTYLLLVLDLDGTVMGDDLVIQPAVRRAIGQAQARGVFVTLSTGRAFSSALSFARVLGIDVPLVCYQGGLIKSPVDGAVLHEETFGTALARELLAWIAWRREQPFRPSPPEGEIPEEWEAWTDSPFEVGAIEAAMFVDGVMYLERVHGGPEFWNRYFGQRVEQVESLDAALHRDPAKSMLIAHPATCDEVLPELKNAFSGRMQIVRSHPLFVEAVPRGVTKGRGVARLAAHLGVSQAATIAVGDNENDLAMVQWAGLGVAMGNATGAVKAAADWVAPTVGENGVAAVIERFILRQKGERAATDQPGAGEESVR
jgi:hydroxymethylpyrimidine pyrophosphatase-like HAD family hydrolase